MGLKDYMLLGVPARLWRKETIPVDKAVRATRQWLLDPATARELAVAGLSDTSLPPTDAQVTDMANRLRKMVEGMA